MFRNLTTTARLRSHIFTRSDGTEVLIIYRILGSGEAYNPHEIEYAEIYNPTDDGELESELTDSEYNALERELQAKIEARSAKSAHALKEEKPQ